jgi:AcrR family transcriptional regulator
MALEVATATLTKSQAARRQRVVTAALALGADGGYDAVQMREVAAHAGVALGTIYRYFSSKDHLLAEAQVEWLLDLDRRVSKKPPKGESVVERVIEVLRRATRAMEQEPRLAEALIVALTSTDPHAARCQRETGEVITRIMASSFPNDFDRATRDDIVRVLGHVWFSSLIGWVNRWYGFDHVGEEVELAAHLLLDQYD